MIIETINPFQCVNVLIISQLKASDFKTEFIIIKL